MYISEFRIKNYKSFLDSGITEIERGFNIIVGQNNSGKTSLLEALTNKALNKPHISIKTKPNSKHSILGSSFIEVTYNIDPEELSDLMAFINPPFYFNLQGSSTQFTQTTLGKIIQDHIKIKCEYINGVITSAHILGTENTDTYLGFSKNQTDNFEIAAGPGRIPISESFAARIAGLLNNRIYTFKAERRILQEFPVQNIEDLSTDGSNIAQVLNYLQTKKPVIFTKLNQLLSKIFSDVKYITVPPNNQMAQVFVWPVDHETGRDDLAVALSESGTGVGQVLSILYVVINSSFPRCILIDEPQSYLHPGAIRALIDILKTFPQHQYIITTHSPIILNAAYPCKVLHIKKDEMESSISQINAVETAETRQILFDIGSRLSDVFGADKILWVEGLTEELCFKLIAEKIVKEPLWGIEILGVKHVGDLMGKHAQTIYDIYDRLSKGVALMPPVVAYIFDRENRKEQEIKDLERKSKNSVRFLSKKMFENYLLNPEALSYLTNNVDKLSLVDSAIIKNWIDDNGNKKEYQATKSIIWSKEWLADVHAGKLLEKMFQELLNTTYDKVKYGPILTQWLIENAPEQLEELIKLLNSIAITEAT